MGAARARQPHGRVAGLLATLLSLLAGLSGCLADGDPETTRGVPTAGQHILSEVVATVEAEFVARARLDARWREAVRIADLELADPDLDSQAVSDAINAALDVLAVSHTRFLPPDDPAFADLVDVYGLASRAEYAGRFPDGRAFVDGIGLLGHATPDGFMVRFVLEGSPAERAGLRAGDLMTHADGEPFHPTRSFAGRAGRRVLLDVQRGSPRARWVTEVEPERIAPELLYLRALTASLRVVPRDGVRVGYAHVWSYAGMQYHEALVEALQRGALAEADALVLDLRDGWGGADPSYLRAFGGRPPVLAMTDRTGATRVFGADDDDGDAGSAGTSREGAESSALGGRPLVVLVDGRTRSGKEALAQGVRTQGLGVLVGERTAGAVTAGRAFALSGGLLVLAVLDVTVDGERLEGVGVPPDVEVVRLLDGSGADVPFERALELAAEVVRTRRLD